MVVDVKTSLYQLGNEPIGEDKYEAFGFAKKHEKKDASENHDSGFRMKDADGHGISIAQVNGIPRDMMAVQHSIINTGEGELVMLTIIVAR